MYKKSLYIATAKRKNMLKYCLYFRQSNAKREYMMAGIYPLNGSLQYYAWGGNQYLPDFLQKRKRIMPNIGSAHTLLRHHS